MGLILAKREDKIKEEADRIKEKADACKQIKSEKNWEAIPVYLVYHGVQRQEEHTT